MIQIDIKITQNISKEIARIQKQIATIPKESLVEFKDLTPIRTGNARRNTSLSGSDKIIANYSYAQQLDAGSSNQAPIGMVKPFERWLRNKLKQIFGK